MWNAIVLGRRLDEVGEKWNGVFHCAETCRRNVTAKWRSRHNFVKSLHLHHLADIPAHTASREVSILRKNAHWNIVARTHRHAHGALDLCVADDLKTETLQNHGDGNLHRLHGENRADACARSGAKRHVFVLRWVDC